MEVCGTIKGPQTGMSMPSILFVAPAITCFTTEARSLGLTPGTLALPAHLELQVFRSRAAGDEPRRHPRGPSRRSRGTAAIWGDPNIAREQQRADRLSRSPRSRAVSRIGVRRPSLSIPIMRPQAELFSFRALFRSQSGAPQGPPEWVVQNGYKHRKSRESPQKAPSRRLKKGLFGCLLLPYPFWGGADELPPFSLLAAKHGALSAPRPSPSLAKIRVLCVPWEIARGTLCD